MKSARPWLFLTTFVGFMLLGVRGASAQGTPKVSRIEERVFLLYALEDLSRRSATNTNRPGRRPESPCVIQGRFLARQRLLYDIMRRYVQKRKNMEILALFETYEKELNLHEEWLKSLNQSWNEFNKKMAAASSAASSRVLMSGLGYALASMASGEEDRQVAARGMNALFRSSIVEGQKLRIFGAAAADQLTTSLNKSTEEFKPKVEKSHKDFRTKFDEYVSASMLEDSEFAVKLDQSKEEPAHNPFLLVAKAQKILRDKDATVKDMMEQAEVCRRAAAMAPADHVYDIYRAIFLGVSGMIANRAAAKDIGVTGFPLLPKGAAESSKLAYKIWTAYSRLEPFDTNYTDDVVQAFILACARAGYAPAGYAVILKTSTTPDPFRRIHPRPASSSRSLYWYDCARVCSTAGNPVLALECLQLAVKLGFLAKDQAKISPDLRLVRESRLTRDRFERLFP